MEPGDRVRCVRGAHDGRVGTVERTTPCYAFVEFGTPASPRVAKKLKRTLAIVAIGAQPEAAAAAAQAAAAAEPGVWSAAQPFVRRYGPAPMLRPDGGRYVAQFGDLPVGVTQVIMELLLMDPERGLMVAAHTCRGWRLGVAAASWTRLDLTALGGWDSRERRRRARLGDVFDLTTGGTNQIIVNIREAFCRWMLHMAQADPSLPTKLLSTRGARRSYGAATDGAANFVEIVARAVNLEHFDGDGRLPQIHAAIRGKPLKTCKGIDDAPTLVSLASTLEDLSYYNLHDVSGTLNRLPRLQRVDLRYGGQKMYDHEPPLTLQLPELQSLHIQGKMAPSLDFGSDLPSLTEYRETNLYFVAECTNDYLGEVLAACCPRIALEDFKPGRNCDRGVWQEGANVERAVWGRPLVAVPFVSNAGRSRRMQEWAKEVDERRRAGLKTCRRGGRLMGCVGAVPWDCALDDPRRYHY